MKIAICGTGYVGLVTGVCLAKIGHNVICVEHDENKVDLLNSGISTIYEPGIDNILEDYHNNIKFTNNGLDAYKDAEAIFVCVGTPENKDGSANLSYVYGAVEEIAKTVQRDCLIVIKSTVPIGTNDEIEKRIKSNLVNSVKIEVASNPEFLSQGTAIRDTLNAKRIVIGTESKWAENILRKIYKELNIPIIATNRKSAEMIKYSANYFLALKITYINEVANLCEIVDANIDDVVKGIGSDDRIGKNFLNAGIGYGGSCFPKDTKALHHLAKTNDYELKLAKATIDANEIQKLVLINKTKKYYDSFKSLTVAVLGLTFKPNTDDIREAPSLKNIPIFLQDGANVRVWDKEGMDNYKKIFPNELKYCNSPKEALEDADICFIFTECDKIKELIPMDFKNAMKIPIVLDGRNCYDPKHFIDSGVTYESIGRGIVK